MRNSNVPYENDFNLKGWFKAINKMFGNIEFADTAYIDVDLGHMPFTKKDELPPSYKCFVFKEITTKEFNNEILCEDALIKNIEEYIENALSEPKDTSKASIFWRCTPQIIHRKDFFKNKDTYRGYCRVLVIDKNSKYENYN